MRTRQSADPAGAATDQPAADWAVQPLSAESTANRRWHDARDTTETALLTKIPATDSAGDEPDGPQTVADRDRYKGPKVPRRERLGRRLGQVRACWPLLPILVVQAYFAWRLLETNTAFIDEATYMWSGRLEADHMLYGLKIPQFQTFFSGAPVIYPVLAAVASKIGGLTGARLLSLLFMLLATTAVFQTGRRLHGMLTGFFAAGLFAALGPTLHLSSYATYDAMALCLLAWSTYFVICFAFGDGRNSMIYAAFFMVLADCTKYACLLWNPIILLLAASAGPGYAAWKCSRSWNLQRFGMVSGTLLALAVIIGRQSYFAGFDHTTLQRKASDSSPSAIASHLEHWIGPLFALSVLGMLAVLWQLRRNRLTKAEAVTMALLLLGGVLAPANQLRIHTLLSLEKHADIGATFAVIPAGYLLARIAGVLGGAARKPEKARSVRYVLASVVVAAVALVPLNMDGDRVGEQLHNTWPSSTQLIAALKPLVHKGDDDYLVENYDVAAYYLPSIDSSQWHDTVSATWTDPTTHATSTGIPAFKAAILAHHYKVIVLDYSQSPATDRAITGTIAQAGYRKLTKIATTSGTGTGSYTIWVLP